MTERSLDELGPVDYLIVEFPAGAQNFTGEGAAELIRLHDAGIIRIMDILILPGRRTGGPWPRNWAISTSSVSSRGWKPSSLPTLAEGGIDNKAAAMDPGSVADMHWSTRICGPPPFASAMRRAGGQLIANGRIPIQAIIAAVEADAAQEAVGV